MAATVAPPVQWIPEDDLLLKNAIEAGASLESLAKGAVQFSRRFTVQELHDRWYTLLYDPVVSEEASVQMTELERFASTSQSKSNRPEGMKETKSISGKRKAESVRGYYYAMRKRICSEPFDAMDMNFLPGTVQTTSGDGYEPSAAGYMVGDPVSDHFGISGPNCDGVQRPCPELGVQNHLEHLPLGESNMPQSILHTYEENGDHCTVPEFAPLKEFPSCNLFETAGLEVKPSSFYGQVDNNESETCVSFGDTSFHNFEYPSPLPQMAAWDTIDGISELTIPIHQRAREQHTGDSYALPHDRDANNSDAYRYGAHSGSNLKCPMPCEDMKHMVPSTEDYLAELSSTLFDFTNDEELLFADVDGNATIDKSYFDGFSSLLLDSPHENELPNASRVEASVASDLTSTDVAHPEKLSSREPSNCGDQHSSPQAQISSVVAMTKSLGPEYRNGVICCTLNTEDPEIPSNDDVFLPFRFPSPSSTLDPLWKLHDSYYSMPSVVKDTSCGRKANIGPNMTKKENKKSHIPNQMMETLQQSEASLHRPFGDSGVKFELPSSNIQHAAPRNSRASEIPKPINSLNVNAPDLLPGVVNECVTKLERRDNHCNAISPTLDKHACAPDSLHNLQKNVNVSKQEQEPVASFPGNGVQNVGLDSMEMAMPEPIMPLEERELYSEDDFDVPYFSDVEAMILDMDLNPDNFDLFSNPEVMRYQHEETKRTIIRLEQASNAYMRRAIAAHGAFAVLYGRQLKYFIKKSEILLGRETEDYGVDIDLTREGQGNKISRRQAYIKLDVHGSFHLKNLGKHPIFVNSKELAPKQSSCLTSGSLIEIRGLAFVFETNQTCVQRYLDNISRKGLL